MVVLFLFMFFFDTSCLHFRVREPSAMASEMFDLIIDFCSIFAQEIVDLNSLSEFLNAFERFRTKAESYILSSFVKIRITAEDSFHVVR